MADELSITIDTRAGRVTLAAGRPFVGGAYALSVETDGEADTETIVRLYRIDPARDLRWPLAEAKGGQELRLDSADFRKAFATVSPSRAMPCEVFAYRDDAIVAHGFVTVDWSPTLRTIDGTPIDVAGPPGPKGDKGEQGAPGEDGKSAYEGAVEQGYEGTEQEFYATLNGLEDIAEACATSARAAAVSAETAAAETLLGAQQLTQAVAAKEDAENAAERAEAAAAGTAGAAESAEAAKDAAEAAKQAAEQVGDVSDHINARDNPHRVTAGQVPFGDDTEAVADISGGDNWGAAWGFDIDLKSIDEEAWAGRPEGTVAKVATVGLQVSGRTGTQDVVWLELTGSDGKVWTSKQTPSWAGSGGAVDYAFDPPAELPGGVMAARFVVTDGSGTGHAMPMRISKVSASETPAGCDVWTAEGGTTKRTDFAPRIRDTRYTLPPKSVAQAIAALQADKQDKLIAGENIAIEGNVISSVGVPPETEERLEAIEQGRGVYRDPDTGEVSTYTPLPECADGTLKLVATKNGLRLVLPVEEDDSAIYQATTDGEYVFLFYGFGDSAKGRSNILYVYDHDISRVARAKLPSRAGERFCYDNSGFFFICPENGKLYAYTNQRLCRFALEDSADNAPEKQLTYGVILCWFFNPQSGNICLLEYRDSAYWLRLYDLDINPILGDDGAPIVKDVSEICASAKIATTISYGCVGVKRVYERVYIYTFNAMNGAILRATAADGLEIVHESLVQEDPDAPGKCLMERTESGALVRDDTYLNRDNRPATTEGPELRFNVKVDESRGFAANAWRTFPTFFGCALAWNSNPEDQFNHLCTDGIDLWKIQADGRFVNLHQYRSGWRGGVASYAEPETGNQNCLTSTKFVPTISVSHGPESWGTEDFFAILFAKEEGLSRLAALSYPRVQRSARVDGALPIFSANGGGLDGGGPAAVPIKVAHGYTATSVGWAFFGQPVCFATANETVFRQL